MNPIATTPAQQLYESLKARREPFLRRARQASALTIPMLVPPASHGPTSDFVDPEQSVGARGVNHLAARLVFTLLPPNGDFFRLVPDAVAEAAMSSDPERRAQTEKELGKIEREVQREVETQALRVPAVEMLKHLLVGGNALMYQPNEGGMMFFPLSKYVTQRDTAGNLLCCVIEEVVSPETLDEKAYQIAMMAGVAQVPGVHTEAAQVRVFTKIWLEGRRYKVHQEINGVVVPGTQGSYLADDNPYRPLRWTTVHGEDYGRGLVEEYIGDLRALERLTRAIVTGALASARLLFLVAPTGFTDPQILNDAENGAFVPGNAEEVAALQVEKFADFRVSQEQIAVISRRLEAAFLLNSSVTRDAERVTAEEIRYVSQELESALGGVYSLLSQEFQLPLVRRLLAQLQKSGVIPKFSAAQKRHIKPAIVTGVEALGRGQELERVRAIFGVLTGVIGPDQVAKVVNLGPLMEFIFTAGGVRIEGLVKTQQQLAQEAQAAQQQAAMQEALSKGTGPAINAISAAQSEANQPAAGPQGAA